MHIRHVARDLAFSLIGLFFVLCVSVASYADASSAALSVTVTDSSGAVVPDAEIVIRRLATDQAQHVTTSVTGGASFAFLKPGSYQLTVSKRQFADVVVNGITLNVGDARHIDIHLKVSAESQTVSVSEAGLTLNTTDASVSTVVDQQFVRNMPLNGRSFQDLISMTPGVTTQNPQTGTYNTPSVQMEGDFSVNGQRTESNYYTVDGVSGNTGSGYPNGYAQNGTTGSIAASTALGTTQSLVSVDALQEFRVSSSTYSAEYGRVPGGQFSLATRSGTNSLHGTLFDYLRNDIFDANDWFNNHNGISKTPLRQNDFGGTLGGPITIPHLYFGRDRSFFFASYEGLRLVQPVAASAEYVPSNSARSAPSPTGEILNAFPLPTGAEILTSSGTASGLAPFVGSFSLPGSIDATSVRLDHHFSDRISAFFRGSYSPTYTSSRYLSTLYRIHQDSTTYTAGTDIAFSNATSNSLRFGIARSKGDQIGELDGFGGATPISFQQALAVPRTDTYDYEPYIYIGGIGSTYIEEYKGSNELHQWNLTDTYAASIRQHQLRVGIDYRHFASPLNPSQIAAYPDYYSPDNLFTNTVSDVFLQKTDTADPVFNEFSAFAQDQWRPLPSLSISVGLRWEVNPPPTAGDGRMAYTASGKPSDPSTLALAPRGTPLWQTAWYNFAPRLGMAWKAHSLPGRETVVRAGGGVFFDTGNQNAAMGFSGLGFLAYSDPTNVTLPISPSMLDFTTDATPPYLSGTVYVFPEHLQLPYTLQWNAAVDQSLGGSQVLTITYLGSSGRRLLQQRQLYVNAINPLFDSVVYYPNDVTSNYQALQVKFQRSVARGLQALASYTWGHSLDYGSTNAAYPFTYGNSDFDVRQNLQGGITWDLPSVHSFQLLDAALRGWGLDGRVNVRSAFPITLVGNALVSPTGLRYYSGVNYDSTKPIFLYGKQYPGGRMLNGGPATAIGTAAFTLPSGTADGNAPRNFVRTFGASQFNLAVRRNFHLADFLSIQFRAETFNIFNHPNFGYVDPLLGDVTFGQAKKMLNSSLGSMSSLYQQGGARSMQFSLKCVF